LYTLVIPATSEADMKRIVNQGKPRKKISRILSQQISCGTYLYVPWIGIGRKIVVSG
jgi:hypothetical protein